MCDINNVGSAGMMEVVCMRRILERSKYSRQVIYQNYILDGDSKIILALRKAQRYGEISISKIKCIGHIKKSMGMRHDIKKTVSTVKIKLQAKAIAGNLALKNFKGDPAWVYWFMCQKQLNVCSKVTVGQKLPDDWMEKKESFSSLTRTIISKKKIADWQITNMDEVTFDCSPKSS